MALKQNTCLRTLIFSDNSLDGMKQMVVFFLLVLDVADICELITSLPSLKTLKLANCDLNSEQGTDILSAIARYFVFIL